MEEQREAYQERTCDYKMANRELIISILLDNDDGFHYLSAKEIAIFMASCKNAYNSEVLQNMRNKHRAWYLYSNAWYMMEEAYMVLKNYRTIADLDFSRKLFDEHKAYVSSFEKESDDVKDCLGRILTAEYKDFLFYMANDNSPISSYYHDLFLLQSFKSVMLNSLSFCDTTIIHDPEHYAFLHLDKHYYTFYDKIEKHGLNTLQDGKCKNYIDMIEGNDVPDDENNL